MPLYIRKASGKKELFNENKFRMSLQKAGADENLIKRLIFEVEHLPNLRSTKDVYSYALNLLQKENPTVATRYNIKRALMELGPAGLPFEQFVAEVFRALGFQVETDQIAQGFCVEHELDLVLTKDSTRSMVECKFHNSQKIKTDVVVALYCKARFDDMKKAWESESNLKKEFHEIWVVTNTKFTSEAIRYATCAGLYLLGWSYPMQDNLPELIDRYSLYPVTALPSLTRVQKRQFIKEGFVLCRDASQHVATMHKYGMKDSEIETFLADVHDLCLYKNHKH